MKAMILGSHGQLGTELSNLFGAHSIGYSKAEVDICSLESIVAKLESDQVDCVINAAAYNKVDHAEAEPYLAYEVNALGPRNLALACAQFNKTLVHISSDYVFGFASSTSPWKEFDCPGPVSAYGISKLAGEHFVRSLAPKHFVLRTCGLYGHGAKHTNGKSNFVETMLKLGQTQDVVRVVDDQFCTPTSTLDLAVAITDLITTEKFGLYHATNAGECTWARFAEEIFKQANLPTTVVPIPSSEYPTKAKRPGYSLLNCDKLNLILDKQFPHWKDSLTSYLDDRNIGN